MTTRREAGGGRREDETVRRRDGQTTDWGLPCQALDLNRIEVWPDPSPEERQAIYLALQFTVIRSKDTTLPRGSSWAAAGKDEAVFGRKGEIRQGWGRSDRRLAGW